MQPLAAVLAFAVALLYLVIAVDVVPRLARVATDPGPGLKAARWGAAAFFLGCAATHVGIGVGMLTDHEHTGQTRLLLVHVLPHVAQVAGGITFILIAQRQLDIRLAPRLVAERLDRLVRRGVLAAEVSATLARVGLDAEAVLGAVTASAERELGGSCAVSLAEGRPAGLAGAAVRTGVAQRSADGAGDPEVAAPLRAGDGALGALTARRTDPYDDDDVEFLQDLADRAGMALANAALHGEVVAGALSLQHALLPYALTAPAGVEVAARYRAAEDHSDVGGDWYDTIALPGRRRRAGHRRRRGPRPGRRLGDGARAGRRPGVRPGGAPALGRAGAGRRLPGQRRDRAPGHPRVRRAVRRRPDPHGGAGRSPRAAGRAGGRAARPRSTCRPGRRSASRPGTVAGAHRPAAARCLRRALHRRAGRGPGVSQDPATLLDDLTGRCSRRRASSPRRCSPARPPPTTSRCWSSGPARRPGRRSPQRSLPPQRISAGVARIWVADLLALWAASGTLPAAALGPDATDAVPLLLTELVSNAVRHSDAPVGLRAGLAGSCLRIEVGDNSHRMPMLRRPGLAETSGRGLVLVDTLSTSWGVDLTEHGKTVWFEADLSAPPPAAGADDGVDEDALLAAFGED